MYLCVLHKTWFYQNMVSMNERAVMRKPVKNRWGHQSSGVRAPELWCLLSQLKLIWTLLGLVSSFRIKRADVVFGTKEKFQNHLI